MAALPSHGRGRGDHRALRASAPVLARSRRRDRTGALVLFARPARRDRLATGRRAGIATLMWVCAFFLTLTTWWLPAPMTSWT